jgi:SpoVK/Ycf46/Vps4 family AAA+-type ATPase
MKLSSYIRAGYPVLYMLTPEESRAELLILEAAKELKYKVMMWSHTDGFWIPGKDEHDGVEDPIAALEQIKKETTKDIIYIFRDAHKYFEVPRVLRLIRDISNSFKQLGKALILLSPVNALQKAQDIERDVTLIEFELPDKTIIKKVWDNLYADYKKSLGTLTEDDHEMIVEAAMGLTTTEAENTFAKAIVDHKAEKIPINKLVLTEKAVVIKKAGILEYYDSPEGMMDVGGLEVLKDFMMERKGSCSKKAREYGLPRPRGIVLAGLPGCGKSLSAKVASNILGVPLIRFDIGKVFGGLVGLSEQNTRTALNQIDAMGSCVVWIDEMEKAFAGMGGSGSNDSGVTQRVVGSILTWMQEKKSPSFVIGTVNRIDNILASMPEMLRKGRWDDIFFVGLPSQKEREEILKIMVKKYWIKSDYTKLDIDYTQLAKESNGFSGAELEESVISGMYKSFSRDKDLNGDYIWASIQNTNPLSKSADKQLREMASWAQTNATYASKVTKDDKLATGVENGIRKLNI